MSTRRMGSARAILGLMLALGIQTPLAAQGRFPPLADWPLLIGDAASTWGLRPDGDGPDATAPDGRWTVTAEPMAHRRMVVHVAVETPAVPMALEPGPAILVTATALQGGYGGDVGYERLVSLHSLALPACTGDPCIFEADVTVDLRRLPRIARRERRLESAWAGVGFTLIRTFGAGSWLQTLTSERLDGTSFSGTPGAPEPWVGSAYPAGLFPAEGISVWRYADVAGPDVQALIASARSELGDTSRPPTTTPVRMVATTTGCTDGPPDMSLMTTDGDQVTARPTRGGRAFVDATWPLPVGTAWRVGFDPDPSRTVEVGDTPLLVTARYRCGQDGLVIEDVAFAEIITPGP